MHIFHQNYYYIHKFHPFCTAGSDGLALEPSHIPSNIYRYSVCSEPCKPGAYRKRLKDRNCCWDCVSCEMYHYVNASDPYLCVRCPTGYIQNQHFNSCTIIPETHFSFSKPFAIVLTILSGLGIVTCTFVVIVFIKYRLTPIVKASGLETSAFLLSGMFMSYCSVFFILSYPTYATCLFTRIILGLSYTIGYSAIFSKLYLLDSAFSTKRNVQKLNFKPKRPAILSGERIRPVHARIIAISLTIVHLIGLLLWSMFEPPSVLNTFPVIGGQARNMVICSDAFGYSYVGALIWPIVLMLCCVIYAVKLRKLPSGFNDKNHIIFCSSISILLWVVFIPVYAFSENNNLRVISLSLALLAHGSLLLVTLFLTKVYIIIFRKGKNTKENVMSSHSRSPPNSKLSESRRRLSDTSFRSDVRQFTGLSHATQTTEGNQAEMKEINGMLICIFSLVDIVKVKA